MYRYSNGQISLSDFKQPMGMDLKENNRWVKKAQTIPWPEIEKRYASLFTNRKGNAAKPLRLALGACIITGWIWLFRCRDSAADSGESIPAILLRVPGLQRREAAFRSVTDGVLPQAFDTRNSWRDQRDDHPGCKKKRRRWWFRRHRWQWGHAEPHQTSAIRKMSRCSMRPEKMRRSCWTFSTNLPMTRSPAPPIASEPENTIWNTPEAANIPRVIGRQLNYLKRDLSAIAGKLLLDKNGHYSKRILADRIYRNRENLNYCKEHGIRISGPALGRPKKDVVIDSRQDFLDECERTAVERSFSLAKRKCGLGLVTARLRETSAHVIAMSILVLNLHRIQYTLLRFLFDFPSSLSLNENLTFVQ